MSRAGMVYMVHDGMPIGIIIAQGLPDRISIGEVGKSKITTISADREKYSWIITWILMEYYFPKILPKFVKAALQWSIYQNQIGGFGYAIWCSTNYSNGINSKEYIIDWDRRTIH